MHRATSCGVIAVIAVVAACGGSAPATTAEVPAVTAESVTAGLARYTTVPLVADTTELTPAERRMLPLLIEAARRDERDLLGSGLRQSRLPARRHRRPGDAALRRDQLRAVGPAGRGRARSSPASGPSRRARNLYPHDMTKAEFDAAVAAGGGARRLAEEPLHPGAARRRAAGSWRSPTTWPTARRWSAPPPCCARPRRWPRTPGLRATSRCAPTRCSPTTSTPSDLAWMEMKNNTLDVVIGPIETYEDALFGYKAANEAYVLIKDQEWSRRLAHYVEPPPRPAARAAGGAPVQARDAGHGPRPERLRRRLLRRPGERRAPRPSPSTCPTTSRCS